MYNKIKIAFITVIMFVSSCQDFETDLEVPNLNDPDRDAIASEADALSSVASGIFQAWFMTVSDYSGPAMAMHTMADAATCSWGNVGMKDLSSEPRVAFNNSTSYGNDVTRSYFSALYKIVSDTKLLQYAIENETAELDNPDQVLLAAKMGQALSIGYLAMVFDRTWVTQEDGEIVEVNHTDAMTYALNKLDEAIALADSGVALPDGSISGADVSGASMSKLLNSFGARMLVNNVRNSAEKASIDWARVETYALNGITEDYTIYMDDVAWYDLAPKTYLVYPGWGRVDMRIINMMDPNTIDYWTNTTIDPLPESTSDDSRLLSDYQYLDSNNFKPERGLYHFSSYRYSRYDDYITTWVMDLLEFAKAENDMYLAEALVQQGDAAGAADVVNNGTRVNRGNLAPVAADAEDVKAAIFYERMVEFSFSTMGISFFEMRKEDLLQPGTLLHFPVPGKSLITIPEDIYTYGGSTGVAGEDYSNGGWRD